MAKPPKSSKSSSSTAADESAGGGKVLDSSAKIVQLRRSAEADDEAHPGARRVFVPTPQPGDAGADDLPPPHGGAEHAEIVHRYADESGVRIQVFRQPDGARIVVALTRVEGDDGACHLEWSSDWMSQVDWPLYRQMDLPQDTATVYLCADELVADEINVIAGQTVCLTAVDFRSALRNSSLAALRGRRVILLVDGVADENNFIGINGAGALARRCWGAGAASAGIVFSDDMAERLASAAPNFSGIVAGRDWESLRSAFESALIATPASPPGNASPDQKICWEELKNAGFEATPWSIVREVLKNDVVERTLVASGGVRIAYETRTASAGDAGVLVEVRGRRGVRQAAISHSDLGGRDPATALEPLRRAGLRVLDCKNLARYLTLQAALAPEAILADSVGWIEDEPGSDRLVAYATPEGKIIRRHDAPAIEVVAGVTDGSTAGTLEGWKNQVAAVAGEHSWGVVALAAIFAAPLLRIMDAPSGGLHWYGNNSIGKSNLLRISLSGWNHPDEDHRKSGMKSWDLSQPGFEGIVKKFNDGVFAVDEGGKTSDKKFFSSFVYVVASGSGRTRGTKNIDAREETKWKTLMVSSAERTIASFLGDVGLTQDAGQTVRLLEIPADRGRGCGIFDFGHGETLAKALEKATRENHGAAGPAFIEWLAARGKTEIRDEIAKTCLAFRKKVDEALGGAVSATVARAADRIALIAAGGELAIKAGILPLKRGRAMEAAAEALLAWLQSTRDGDAMSSTESLAVITRARDAIMKYGTMRFEYVDRGNGDLLASERYGWRDREIYVNGESVDSFVRYFTPESFKNVVAKTLDVTTAGRMLHEAGLLAATGRDSRSGKLTYYSKMKICGKSVKVYAVRMNSPDGEARDLEDIKLAEKEDAEINGVGGK